MGKYLDKLGFKIHYNVGIHCCSNNNKKECNMNKKRIFLISSLLVFVIVSTFHISTKAAKVSGYSKNVHCCLTSENLSSYDSPLHARNISLLDSEAASYPAGNRQFVKTVYSPTIHINYLQLHTVVGGSILLIAVTTPSSLPVTWSSSNTSIASVSGGLVLGITEGTATITATYTDAVTGISYSDSVVVTIWDSIGIKDDTDYYIMNYSSHKYLSLLTNSDTDNTNVCTRAKSTTAVCQWTTEKQSNGSFQLISCFSSSGRVLNVTNNNVDIYTDNNLSTQKFYIYRINSGPYKGLYYIRYGNYYVAEDSYYNTQYGYHDVYLTSSFSSRAVWSFAAVEKRDADLYSFCYSNNDTTGCNDLYDLTMSGIGYNAYGYFTNQSASNAFNYLNNSDDVFVFFGHGGPGIIGFYNTNGISTGAISVNASVCNLYIVGSDRKYIDNISKNNLALARAVLLIGCSTGVDCTIGGVTYNLVSSIYNKGAHFVLGTTEDVSIPDSEKFLEGFLTELDNNNTNIYSCVQSGIVMAGVVSNTSGAYPVFSIGDGIQYLG